MGDLHTTLRQKACAAVQRNEMRISAGDAWLAFYQSPILAVFSEIGFQLACLYASPPLIWTGRRSDLLKADHVPVPEDEVTGRVRHAHQRSCENPVTMAARGDKS